MHVITGEVCVTQICPSINVRRVKRFICHQCIENRDMTLPTNIPHGLRITRVGTRTCIRNACVIDIMTERCVHVPKCITPSFGTSFRMSTSPPSCVPIQPIHTHDIAVQNEIIDQTHRVELRDGILIICIHSHVLTRDEIHQIIPIITTSIFLPCATPCFQKVDKVTRLIIIFSREIRVVHFLTIVVHPPILTI